MDPLTTSTLIQVGAPLVIEGISKLLSGKPKKPTYRAQLPAALAMTAANRQALNMDTRDILDQFRRSNASPGQLSRVISQNQSSALRLDAAAADAIRQAINADQSANFQFDINDYITKMGFAREDAITRRENAVALSDILGVLLGNRNKPKEMPVTGKPTV